MVPVGFVLVFVAASLWSPAGAAIPTEEEAKIKPLTPDDIAAIKRAWIKRNCDALNPKKLATRNVVKRGKILEYIYELAVCEVDANRLAEIDLAAMSEAEKSIREAEGLSFMAPDGDGLWQGDISMTAKQALRFENSAKFGSELRGGRKKRTAGTYFNYGDFKGLKWKMPINYFIAPEFDGNQTEVIHEVLWEIGNKTACIRFEENKKPFVGPQIRFNRFLPDDGNECGWSSVGNQGDGNEVQINMDSCMPNQTLDDSKIVVFHEVLHTLGLGHTQARHDRAKYITMEWEEMTCAGLLDYVGTDAPTQGWNTYGTKYDYDSIMHYAPLTNSDTGKLAITPKVLFDKKGPVVSRMGRNSQLSEGDVELLNKMYCAPDSCDDKNPYCGTWGSQGKCEEAQYADFMKTNCLRSCGLCNYR